MHYHLFQGDPMPTGDTHDSVTEMAKAYAQRAVGQARDYHAVLDYSENSLMELEVILSQISDAEQSPDQVTETCKLWGSYLGEVVRKQFGGEWSVEPYPGKQFSTLTLTVNGSKLFPSMKIHRRLTQGVGENIWSFYKMIKSRLDATPRTIH
jgi:hypothetical protein